MPAVNLVVLVLGGLVMGEPSWGPVALIVLMDVALVAWLARRFSVGLAAAAIAYVGVMAVNTAVVWGILLIAFSSYGSR